MSEQEELLAIVVELEDMSRRCGALRHRAAKLLAERPLVGPCCTHQCAPRPEPVPMCSEAMDDLDEEEG